MIFAPFGRASRDDELITSVNPIRYMKLMVLFFLAIFLALGCSSDNGGGPDTTPPAAVSDLSVVAVTDSSATLRWTAPGDDGMTGMASGYDIRRATSAITDANWGAATSVGSPPAPQSAGTEEILEVDGLSAGTAYCFALKARDEASNWSDLSNVACTGQSMLFVSTGELDFGTTGTRLAFAITNGGAGTLTWTVTDDRDWVDVSPTGGSTTTEEDSVAVTVSRSGLDAGSYSGTVTVVPGAGSPESVSVHMTVPDTLDLNGYWKIRLESNTNPDPADRGDCIRFEHTGSTIKLYSYCYDDGEPLVGTLTGDSLYFYDPVDELSVTGRATADRVEGTWADKEDGVWDGGTWYAVRLDYEPDQYDCVAVNTDVLCGRTHDDRYIIIAQIDDYAHIVETASVSGEILSGDFALSDTIYPEETDEWWTDLEDPGLVISVGTEPVFPLMYQVDIGFTSGASREVSIGVGRWYWIEADTVFRGCDYFPISEGNHWEFNTGTMEVEGSTHDFADGIGLRTEQDLVFENDPGIIYLNCIDSAVVWLGTYDADELLYANDPIDGLASILAGSMYVGATWTLIGYEGSEVVSIGMEVLGVESVTVPAGTFEGCLRIQVTISDESGQSYTDEVYYADGVGPVKQNRIGESGPTDGYFLWVNQDYRAAELQSAFVDGVDYP